MNRRAFELAFSTLVVLVLALLLVIAIAYALTSGFQEFGKTRTMLVSNAEVNAFKEACALSCKAENVLSFCCSKLAFEGSNISCMDERLKGECELQCKDVKC